MPCHGRRPRLLPRDPGGEAEASPVALYAAEACGPEELDVPGGSDGEERRLLGQGLRRRGIQRAGGARWGRTGGWAPSGGAHRVRRFPVVSDTTPFRHCWGNGGRVPRYSPSGWGQSRHTVPHPYPREVPVPLPSPRQRNSGDLPRRGAEEEGHVARPGRQHFRRRGGMCRSWSSAIRGMRQPRVRTRGCNPCLCWMRHSGSRSDAPYSVLARTRPAFS